MERYYHIAGTDICIIGNPEEMNIKEGFLEAFRSEKKKESRQYFFSVVDELDEPKGICVYNESAKQIFCNQDKQITYIGSVKNEPLSAYIRCELLDNKTFVQVKKSQITEGITSKIILRSIGIENLIVESGGLILHSSFINVGEKAILFTAPSGTGKSTQADLWRKYRNADIVNGDRSVITIRGNHIEACSLPYAGSSMYCKNGKIPLAAIVSLEQAQETTIERIKGMTAFRKIWAQITVPVLKKDAVEVISERVVKVLENVPVYHLACTPDESAIIALEEELWNSKMKKEKIVYAAE